MLSEGGGKAGKVADGKKVLPDVHDEKVKESHQH